jgi:hypothetical protein
LTASSAGEDDCGTEKLGALKTGFRARCTRRPAAEERWPLEEIDHDGRVGVLRKTS